jgi:hypothetical protein
MHQMRTTVELSARTYTRLRARAAEQGMRGFSAIVEEALERHLDRGGPDPGLAPELAEVEGAWSEDEVEEWERAREEAWATWQPGRSSTPTS